MQFTTYLESWDANLDNTLKYMPIDQYTTVNLSFASFNFDNNDNIGGLAISEEKIKDIIKTVKCRGGKINLAFGGQTTPYFLSKSNLWPNTQKISDAILRIVKKYNFDGIDLDIEEPFFDGLENRVTELLFNIRQSNANIFVSYTIPGQGWNSYWQSTASDATANNRINAVNFMEYDIWVGEKGFVEQIKEDIDKFYIHAWDIDPSKIVIGLMPGKDDGKNHIRPEDAKELTEWAKKMKLQGIMIWDANRDYAGADNYDSYEFTRTILKNLN